MRESPAVEIAEILESKQQRITYVKTINNGGEILSNQYERVLLSKMPKFWKASSKKLRENNLVGLEKILK